jgi:hypothetical protein
MTLPSDDLPDMAYHSKEHTSLVTFLYSLKFLLDSGTVQTNSMCVYGTVQTNGSMYIYSTVQISSIVCIQYMQINGSVYVRYNATSGSVYVYGTVQTISSVCLQYSAD